MSYTVTLPNGVRFTLCQPGVSEGAESERQQVGNREQRRGDYKMIALKPSEARLFSYRFGNLTQKRYKKKLKESPSPASAEAQPHSE